MAINPLSSLAVAAASTLLAKANTGPGALAVGKVVALTDIDALDSLFPYVVKASLAKANDASIADAQLAVLVSRMAGAGSVANNDLLILAREGPLYVAYTGADPAAGDPVFVNNTGDIKLVAGDNSRVIGKVMGHGGGHFSFWFTGLAGTGGGGTPGDAPYMLDAATLPSGFSGGAARLLRALSAPQRFARPDGISGHTDVVVPVQLESTSEAVGIDLLAWNTGAGSSLMAQMVRLAGTVADNPVYGSEQAAFEAWVFSHGASTEFAPRMRVNALGIQLLNSASGAGTMGVLKKDEGDLIVGGDHVSAGLRLRSGGVDRWRLINNTGVLRSLGGSSSSSGTAAPLDLRNDQGGPGANGIGVSLVASVSNSVSAIVNAAGLIMQLRDVTDGAEQGQLIFAATRPSLSPILATLDWVAGLLLNTDIDLGGGSKKVKGVAAGTAPGDVVTVRQVGIPLQIVYGARSTFGVHAGAIAAFDELCALGGPRAGPVSTIDPSTAFPVPPGAGLTIQGLSVVAGAVPATEPQTFYLYIVDGVNPPVLLSTAVMAAGSDVAFDGTPTTIAATGGNRGLVVTYAQAAGGALAGSPVANVLYTLT